MELTGWFKCMTTGSEMVLTHFNQCITTVNGNISKESRDFGAKVVAMFERQFNSVALAA